MEGEGSGSVKEFTGRMKEGTSHLQQQDFITAESKPLPVSSLPRLLNRQALNA